MTESRYSRRAKFKAKLLIGAARPVRVCPCVFCQVFNHLVRFISATISG